MSVRRYGISISSKNVKFDFFNPGGLIWKYLCRFYQVIGIYGRCPESINDKGGVGNSFLAKSEI